MHMRKGFTLIELLVVIAIIAILAAILFPVFAKAREKARQSSCQSNMKELGLACSMYSDDYDETNLNLYLGGQGATDLTQPDDGATITAFSWRSMTQPYIKNWQIHICPSGKSICTMTNREGGWGVARIGNYGWNMTAWGDGRPDGRSMADFPVPATTIELGEVACARACVEAGCPGGSCGDPNNYNPNETYEMWHKRHNEGANFTFYDGHVKWLKTTRRGDFTMRED
jgi:prepilin-type N-terminal cleavage/methylation domain-containing protein/prepilin-type processing-associated H-X9-DG protein